MAYTYDNNDQVYKGDLGPLIDLMVWPQTDNAKDYLTPLGARRQVTAQTASTELDNAYFNVVKNKINAKTNRIMVNLGLLVTPFSWGSLKTNLGADTYTNQNLVLRDPGSLAGAANNGVLDQADVITRNLNAQTVLGFNPHPVTRDLSISGLLGHAVTDNKTTTDAMVGTGFVDPNFVSMNNTSLRTPRATLEQRRVVSLFGQGVIDYKNFWYLTVTGRNDWTSTIPVERNSFFYPSISTSFIFSDAFPAVARFMTGKLRAAYAEVGKDARPYAYRAALESKSTSFGGYGYGFWGPNPALKPAFAKSWENGTQVGLSTMSLTGLFYLRNKDCKLLIDPTTGLPIRSSDFINGGCGGQPGYDRQPDFTIGITNTFRYKRVTLDFLVDIRKGGDVFDATDHYLATRGLSMLTLDRDQPRVISGVLRDGKENSANPTVNTIVVIPSVQPGYYTNMSEELFIERDINWLRLRDVQ